MKRFVILIILCAAFLAACGSTTHHKTPPAPKSHCTTTNTALGCNLPPARLAVPNASAPVRAYGIDFAWSSPSAAFMRANGFSFGASYLSYDESKNWHAPLVQEYAQAGIARVFVWETTVLRPLGGCFAGQSDARTAASQGQAFGARAFYFAVDFELQPFQYNAVKEYFRCAGKVVGISHLGAYGGIATIRLLFNAGLIHYGWQTYAWSGGQWDSRAQLQQYLNGEAFDRDRAVAADYGQSPYVAPKPPPPPLSHKKAAERLHETQHKINRTRVHLRNLGCRVKHPPRKCDALFAYGQKLHREARFLHNTYHVR